MSNLIAEAEAFAAATPRRRCLICCDATDEVREAVAALRRNGLSAAKIVAFLQRTDATHGHGCVPSAASLDNHFNRHHDPAKEQRDAQKAEPRRRR